MCKDRVGASVAGAGLGAGLRRSLEDGVRKLQITQGFLGHCKNLGFDSAWEGAIEGFSAETRFNFLYRETFWLCVKKRW